MVPTANSAVYDRTFVATLTDVTALSAEDC
jgi:hypothetical protein